MVLGDTLIGAAVDSVCRGQTQLGLWSTGQAGLRSHEVEDRGADEVKPQPSAVDLQTQRAGQRLQRPVHDFAGGRENSLVIGFAAGDGKQSTAGQSVPSANEREMPVSDHQAFASQTLLEGRVESRLARCVAATGGADTCNGADREKQRRR